MNKTFNHLNINNEDDENGAARFNKKGKRNFFVHSKNEIEKNYKIDEFFLNKTEAKKLEVFKFRYY